MPNKSGGTGAPAEVERDENGQFAPGMGQANVREKKDRRAKAGARARARQDKKAGRTAGPGKTRDSAGIINPPSTPRDTARGNAVGVIGGAPTDAGGWVAPSGALRDDQPVVAPSGPITASANIPRPFTPGPRFGRR